MNATSGSGRVMKSPSRGTSRSCPVRPGKYARANISRKRSRAAGAAASAGCGGWGSTRVATRGSLGRRGRERAGRRDQGQSEEEGTAGGGSRDGGEGARRGHVSSIGVDEPSDPRSWAGGFRLRDHTQSDRAHSPRRRPQRASEPSPSMYAFPRPWRMPTIARLPDLANSVPKKSPIRKVPPSTVAVRVGELVKKW